MGNEAGYGGSTTARALAEALVLVEGALDGLRAAGDVEWASRAADLYRTGARVALHGLAQDREVLDGVLRQAGTGWQR